MRITICAVGRGKRDATHPIIEDYIKKFQNLGRGLGLSSLTIKEVDAQAANVSAESALLIRALPENSYVIVLDQRGKSLTSLGFAKIIQTQRDEGLRDLTFVIGGAEGVSQALQDRANQSISLGAMVFPHMLARLILAEQLYRSATILANHPYHRE